MSKIPLFIFSLLLLNLNLCRAVFSGDQTQAHSESGVEYLIITPDIFIPALQTLKVFRIRQGISTLVVGTSVTGSNFSDIKNYINEAYNTWQIPPVSILLIGDHSLLPSGVWNNYALSDNLYADINGDELPDLFLARIPVTNCNELDQIINRIISAETDPVLDPYYYDHTLACTDFSQPQSTGWMVAEILNGFYTHVLNKNPERQYAGPIAPSAWPDPTLLQLFGTEGLGYIPESPDYLSGFSGGNAAGINDALNSGAMTFFCINNQGTETGINSPLYQTSDLAGLNGHPDYFISVNSLNGKFNYSNSNCLAEAYLKNNHAGLGVIAASEVIYSSGSEWFTIGLIDGLWDEFLPAYENLIDNEFKRPCQALLNAKYFLYSLPYPINPQVKKTFYHLFNYFGDPYSVLFTDVPQDLQVIHPEYLTSGLTEIEIVADSGAIIALVNGLQLLGTYHSTGNPQVYLIPSLAVGDSLHITVTKQNFRRYHAVIPCRMNTGSNEITELNNFRIFPNPANDQLNLSWFQFTPGKSDLEIFNQHGQRVQIKGFCLNEAGSIQIKLDVSGLNQGVYFLTFHDGKQQYNYKFLIIKKLSENLE